MMKEETIEQGKEKFRKVFSLLQEAEELAFEVLADGECPDNNLAKEAHAVLKQALVSFAELTKCNK